MWGRGGGESHGLIFDHPKASKYREKKSPQVYLVNHASFLNSESGIIIQVAEEFPQLILIIRAGGGLKKYLNRV